MSVRNIFADESHDIYTVRTHADGPDGEAIRSRIETLLAGTSNSDKPTQTM